MIYLDTCLVIYLVEDAERGPHVRELLARHGHEEFAISPLVRLECLVGRLRSRDPELEDRYRGALDLFVELPGGCTAVLRGAARPAARGRRAAGPRAGAPVARSASASPTANAL